MGVSQFLHESFVDSIDSSTVPHTEGSPQLGAVRDGVSAQTASAQEQLYVLIPAYNEEGAIGDLLSGIERVLKDCGECFRVIVVDDGSTDRTADVVRSFAGRFPLELIQHRENRNLGGAMKTGLHHVASRIGENDILLTMDADNTHPPDVMPTLLEAIRDGKDVVVGSRYQGEGGVQGVPWHRNVLSFGARVLFQTLFPVPGLKDYTGSYRAYRGVALRRAFTRWGERFVGETGFTCMPEILVKLRGLELRFSEVPLVIRYDQKVGPSKMKVARNVFASLAMMWRLKREAPPPDPRRVGMISVPWTGIPPRAIGSIGHISHEIAKRLLPRYDVELISGTSRVDPTEEHPNLRYTRLGDVLDRTLVRLFSALGERVNLQRTQGSHFFRAGYHRFYAWRAARRLRRFGAGTVIVQFFPQWLPLLRKMIPGSRLILWMQAETLSQGPTSIQKPLENADRVVSCGAHMTRTIREALPQWAGHCLTIPNGFDPQRYSLKEESRVSGRILYVGRVTPEKGVHVLVEAVRDLIDEGRDLELLIVGPRTETDLGLLNGLSERVRRECESFGDSYQQHLDRLAEETGGRVKFVGEKRPQELPGYYQNASLFVHPTLWDEPFGMPVVEAMACGTPVVAGRAGAMEEILDDGITGFLVEPGDVQALADTLRGLLEDPARARAVGRCGARKAHGQYTWDHVAEETAELIGEGIS